MRSAISTKCTARPSFIFWRKNGSRCAAGEAEAGYGDQELFSMRSSIGGSRMKQMVNAALELAPLRSRTPETRPSRR